DKRYRGEITLINKKLSNQSSVEVHCHFEQYDSSLLPGMFMNAEIELSGNQSNTLPEDAIVRFEGKTFIFVSKGKSQFELQEVQAGNTEDNFTEINGSEDLTNLTFVTKGAYNLLMTLKNNNDE